MDLTEKLKKKAAQELNAAIDTWYKAIVDSPLEPYHLNSDIKIWLGQKDEVKYLTEEVRNKINGGYIYDKVTFSEVLIKMKIVLFKKHIEAYETRITNDFYNKVQDLDAYVNYENG